MRPRFVPRPRPTPVDVPPCPCCRWHARDAEHPAGFCAECRVCQHCEQRPTVSKLGLCERCSAHNQIRVLYRRGQDFDPAWEQHLRQLAQWYRRQMAARQARRPSGAAGA